MNEKKEVKAVYSYRIEPSIKKQVDANAKACDTDASTIIRDAFVAFNKTFEKANKKS